VTASTTIVTTSTIATTATTTANGTVTNGGAAAGIVFGMAPSLWEVLAPAALVVVGWAIVQ
jgi:hypothetical protein